jgi:Holliday junction resolvase RusA-like endonuclease
MDQKDLMRHHRADTPCYLIWIHHQPNLGKHKQEYIQAVRESALKMIASPIKTNDVEVEVLYSTSISRGSRADVDNITKPTLDGLVGAAFEDDRQVRSVTSTVFQRTEGNVIDGRVEHMGQLFYTKDKHVLLIGIYSDTRLQELGGETVVKEQRLKEFFGNGSQAVVAPRKWWKFWKW